MSTPTHSRWRLLSRATPLFGLSLLALTGFAAWRQLRALSLDDVYGALAAVSPAQWALCLLLCAVSYLALAGYEWLAARHIGHELPALRVLGIGAISWAISNTLGPAWLSGSAVRMRLYGREGLSTIDVAKIVAFGMLTFWASFVVLAAGAVAIDPPDALGPGSRSIAVAVLGLCALLVAISARVRQLRIGALHIALPTPSVIAAQLIVGLADNLAAIGALYVLLPVSQSLSFPEVVSLFALSNLGGLLSGLPGGLGTLDSSLVALASPAVGTAAIVAAVLAWRVLYGLVPLLLALLALAGIEIMAFLRARSPSDRATECSRVGERVSAAELARTRESEHRGGSGARKQASLAPMLLSLTSGIAGLVLLLTAVTRDLPDRLHWLSRIDLIALLDASNAACAAIGAGLLLVARGLWLRTRESYEVSLLLVLAGLFLSSLRGITVEEAVMFGAMLALAAASRDTFYRRAALTEAVSLPRGLAHAVCVTIIVSAVLPVVLGQEPLAPSPALRAAGITLSAVAAVVLGWGLRPKTAVPDVPSDEDLSDAVRIAQEAGVPNGWLAATGDKALLFDEARRAFLMFAVAGDTWVSYAGPIGDPSCLPSLLEDFRARATRAGARIALYQIPCALVPLCADLGLRSYKLGEEARVPLRDFTLAGRANKSRRSTVTRAQREGSSFEIVAADRVSAIAGELSEVSSAWLREKGGREKGFSLGRFDERYLSRTPVAVVRREGAVIAFANVLAAGQELSVDLMRVRPDAPNGTMDYLFLSLLCWGNAEGYAHFNLGMAPLSGLPGGPTAPAWAKLGHLVYTRGESFYRFQGLRAFKEKFHPDWEPLYLAAESGLSLPPTLRALLVLVSGGLRASLLDRVKAQS